MRLVFEMGPNVRPGGSVRVREDQEKKAARERGREQRKKKERRGQKNFVFTTKAQGGQDQRVN